MTKNKIFLLALVLLVSTACLLCQGLPNLKLSIGSVGDIDLLVNDNKLRPSFDPANFIARFSGEFGKTTGFGLSSELTYLKTGIDDKRIEALQALQAELGIATVPIGKFEDIEGFGLSVGGYWGVPVGRWLTIQPYAKTGVFSFNYDGFELLNTVDDIIVFRSALQENNKTFLSNDLGVNVNYPLGRRGPKGKTELGVNFNFGITKIWSANRISNILDTDGTGQFDTEFIQTFPALPYFSAGLNWKFNQALSKAKRLKDALESQDTDDFYPLIQTLDVAIVDLFSGNQLEMTLSSAATFDTLKLACTLKYADNNESVHFDLDLPVDVVEDYLALGEVSNKIIQLDFNSGNVAVENANIREYQISEYGNSRHFDGLYNSQYSFTTASDPVPVILVIGAVAAGCRLLHKNALKACKNEALDICNRNIKSMQIKVSWLFSTECSFQCRD